MISYLRLVKKAIVNLWHRGIRWDWHINKTANSPFLRVSSFYRHYSVAFQAFAFSTNLKNAEKLKWTNVSHLTYNILQHFGWFHSFCIHSFFFFQKQPYLWFNGQFIRCTNTVDKQSRQREAGKLCRTFILRILRQISKQVFWYVSLSELLR